MVEVRYRTRILQVFDTGYLSDETTSAVDYIKRVSGMKPEEAKRYGWYMLTSHRHCAPRGWDWLWSILISR